MQWQGPPESPDLREELEPRLAVHVQVAMEGAAPPSEREEGQRHRDGHIDAHHAHLRSRGSPLGGLKAARNPKQQEGALHIKEGSA